MEITYYQGSEFIDHEFRKQPIEMEYGIVAKPSTLGNPMPNAILEHIHQVLGNLVRICNITQTYVDKDDPLMVILYAAAFAIQSTTNSLKGYSTGQLSFGRYMIILIKTYSGLGINTSDKLDENY